MVGLRILLDSVAAVVVAVAVALVLLPAARRGRRSAQTAARGLRILLQCKRFHFNKALANVIVQKPSRTC